MTNNYTKKNKAHNSFIIEALMLKHNACQALVYHSIKGERKSKKSDLIRKDYLQLNKLLKPITDCHNQEIQKIIEEFINAENANS